MYSLLVACDGGAQYRGQSEALLAADNWALMRDFLGPNCKPAQVSGGCCPRVVVRGTQMQGDLPAVAICITISSSPFLSAACQLHAMITSQSGEGSVQTRLTSMWRNCHDLERSLQVRPTLHIKQPVL